MGRQTEGQLAEPELEAELEQAAFGESAACWPLPHAKTPRGLWWRAVAAGGQGRYAAAVSDLTALQRVATGPLASLAHSTHGSFLRQLGWHHIGRDWDGRAWALAGDDVEAGQDALVGLAADALGVGRFPASQALLGRARAALRGAEHQDPPARLTLRLAWVSAELAMVSGDGAAAVTWAAKAAELASREGIGARHRVKTALVQAAAHCSVGNLDAARVVADEACVAAERFGLVPLRWALASLLADIGSAALARNDLLAVRDACAEVVRIAGGTWQER